MPSYLDTVKDYIIIGNYGNDTLALIQWVYENELTQVHVLSVDTGWGAVGWDAHVAICEQRVQKYGFQAVRLVSAVNFANLIKQRGHFPSTKFQWCANVLKGAPLLTWLDQYDPSGSSIILLAHRRASARSKHHLPAHISESETFGERDVHYPLISLSTFERDALLTRAGFSVMTHRSLECDPCINSDWLDLTRLSPDVLERTNQLEMTIHQTMFTHLDENLSDTSIYNLVKLAQEHGETHIHSHSDVLENMGCGDPYGCGI